MTAPWGTTFDQGYLDGECDGTVGVDQRPSGLFRTKEYEAGYKDGVDFASRVNKTAFRIRVLVTALERNKLKGLRGLTVAIMYAAERIGQSLVSYK